MNLLRITSAADQPQAPIQMVAFHPDGRRWAAAGPGTVAVWDGDTQLGEFEASPVHALAFSDDGDHLLASPHRIDLERMTLSSAAAASGRFVDDAPTEEGAFGGGRKLVTSVLSPDGAELVAVTSFRAGRGPRASSERPAEPEQILVLDPRSGAIRRVLFRGDGTQCQVVAVDARYIVAADVDVWNWSRVGQTVEPDVLRGPAFQVRQLRFSAEGTMLAGVDAEGMVTLWETLSGTQLARWKAHDDNAPVLAFHPDGTVLATGSGDRSISLWAVSAVGASSDARPTPSLLCRRDDLGGFVEGLAFSPSGDRLLAAVGGVAVFFTVDEASTT